MNRTLPPSPDRSILRTLRHAGAALFLVAGFGLLPAPASAQATRADSAAVLLQAARTFEAEGRGEIAGALLEYITERYGDTPAGQTALEQLRTAPPEGGGQGSQVELMVWSTLYGSWLGVAIPAAFGADETAPYGLGLLLGAPGGFLAGRTLGESRSMSEGQVRAITLGGTWGTWQGFGWAEVFDWGGKDACDFDYCDVGSPDSETYMKSMVVGGLAGVATGAILARNPIRAGVATSANFGALWGSWFGVAGGVIADQEGDGLLATTLLMGNAGLVGGALVGSRTGISRPRARLISIAGVLGGLAGGGVDLLITPEDTKVAMAIPLAGSLAGLAAGAMLTRDDSGRRMAAGGDEGLFRASTTPALLHFGDGGFTPGIPAPFVTALPVETPRGALAWKPGLGVALFSAAF